MTIAVVADHDARALARLLEQYKGKPRLSGIIAAGASQAQDLEDTIFQLQEERGLETAEGAQLDVLGRIVDTPRNAYDDDTYRQHIRAKIQYNRANGSIPDLLRIFRLIVPEGATLTLVEYAPASFVLFIGGAVATEDPEVLRFFLGARPAGVRGFIQYSLASPAETFTFDTGPGFDVGHLAGEVE